MTDIFEAITIAFQICVLSVEFDDHFLPSYSLGFKPTEYNRPQCVGNQDNPPQAKPI